jgi:uncharacterized protein
MMISKDLVEIVQREFALRLDGVHGAAHWVRVRDNGLRLAELIGTNSEVVELFAFLHDSKRLNDAIDPDHGRRASEFARTLRGSLIVLSDEDFESLVLACEHHSNGLTEADITVQVCWDADRLDLGRIGVKPDVRYLCTSAAKEPEMIEWAFDRSRQTVQKGWDLG